RRRSHLLMLGGHAPVIGVSPFPCRLVTLPCVGYSIAATREGPKVCRLSAGGKWIRTFGSARRGFGLRASSFIFRPEVFTFGGATHPAEGTEGSNSSFSNGELYKPDRQSVAPEKSLSPMTPSRRRLDSRALLRISCRCSHRFGEAHDKSITVR